MKKGCGKKGCLFGCIGTFLGVLLILGLTSYWLVKKESYVPPKAMLFPDTNLYLKAEVTPEDEKTVEFLLTLLQRMNQKQFEDMGHAFPFLMSGDMSSEKARKDIRKILPMRIEVSGDLVEEDLVLATGFSFYNNMAKMGFWFLKRTARKSPDGIYKEIEGKAYFKPNANDRFFVALENNVFYMSRKEASMRRVLDPASTPAMVEELHPTLINVNQESITWGMIRGGSLGETLKDLELNGSDYGATSVGVQLGDAVMQALVFDMAAESQDSLVARFFCDVSLVDDRTETALNQLFDDWIANLDASVEKTITPEERGYLVTLRMAN